MDNSKVYKELLKTEQFANENNMKINYKKTKVMLFNPCTGTDFQPELKVNEQDLEVVQEVRLLGLIIRSDMKWCSNTTNMVQRASKRLWILRRLKNLGAKSVDLIDVYIKQVRCILELAVPAWQGGLTQEEKQDIERVQKSACYIILGKQYIGYQNALKLLKLESLESRRVKLSLKFALRAEKHQKFIKWFKPTHKTYNTRNDSKYLNVRANHTRFLKSPLSFLTSLLNNYYKDRQSS